VEHAQQDRPPRPHTGFTEDGRRIAQVLSYTRRGMRMNPKQAAAWEEHHEAWWIPDQAVDDPDFRFDSWFGRTAPLVVEIGSGIGEATVALAASRPEVNVLAFEVWHPGVAETFQRIAREGVENVRLVSVDAVWSVEHLLGEGSIEELWTFFPDPWPKKRHHRRRLVSSSFAGVVGTRLRPGGLWRLATDWPDYAEQMAAVLDAEPSLTNVYEGPAPRWSERPRTRFERRGDAEGRPATEFVYRRV
jgi:tRNA (guanine-N7-)-methyltransferase